MPRGVIDNRYRLDESIATGGMAEVWAAYDTELDRPVALKLLLSSADPARFSREARAAAALSHPNICQLYDFGDADGRPYIVLEYLPGGTLEDRLSSGEPLPTDEAARIANEIAAGLAHAHARGLVHRDIKPANVLFDAEGAAKITDFGIARIEDVSTLTEAGTMLGTAAYISPEQAGGGRVTPATDVYAFGVILYRMLTGKLPFEAESPLELAAKHANEEPASILSVRPDAPPELERVATATLAKRPEDRPADGSALLTLLEGGGDADAETALLAAPPPAETARTEVIPAWPGRRARPVAIGAALALLAATGATAALLASSDDSNAPVTERTSSVRTSPAGPTTDGATTSDSTRRQTTTREPPISRPRTSPPPPPPAPPSPAPTPPAVPTQVTAPELPPVPTETPSAPLPTTGETPVPPTTPPTTIP